MNLFGLLRALASGQPVDPHRARVLLDRLEKAMPGLASVHDHRCQAVGAWFPDSLICQHCGGAMHAREHGCEPGWDQMTSTGEHGGNVKYAIKCVVCGREMTAEEVRRAG